MIDVDQASTSALRKYLPKVVIDYHEEQSKAFAKVVSKTEFKPKLPDTQEIDCVSMFIDVANFTIMTSDLAQYPDGSGQLASALNLVMNCIVKKIKHINGDILKFAGDAILVVWPVKKTDRAQFMETVDRVVKIGYDIVKNLEIKEFTVIDPDNKDNLNTNSTLMKKKLEVKVGISYGKSKIIYLGGAPDNIVKNRCEYLPVGPALNEAFHAEGNCKPSTLVITKKIRDLDIILEHFELAPVIDDKKKAKQKHLNIFPPVPGSPRRKITKATGGKLSLKKAARGKSRKRTQSKHSFVSFNESEDFPKYYFVQKEKEGRSVKRVRAPNTSFEGIGKLLWSYIPVAIFPYINGVSVESWLPEMRTVTTLFCTLNVDQLKINRIYEDEHLFGPADETKFNRIVDKIQKVFKTIQKNVFKYQGTVNKFLVDDKGCSVLIGFGLPPFAHVSDPDRGALCAYRIMGSLAELNVLAHVGITTGVVYCGAIGGSSGKSSQRIEYTIIGDPINVAARLMVAAKMKSVGIIMDDDTRILLREKVPCTGEVLYLKGKGNYKAYIVDSKVKEKRLMTSAFTNRRSLKLFSSSLVASQGTATVSIEPTMQSQYHLGQEEGELVGSHTGANLKGKLGKLNVDGISKSYFDSRLKMADKKPNTDHIILEYEDGKEFKTHKLDLVTNKKRLTIGEIKLMALRFLYESKWSGLSKMTLKKETEPSVTPESLTQSKLDPLLTKIDVEQIHLKKIAHRFALFWRMDWFTKTEEYIEFNDAFSLSRFNVTDKSLIFKIKRSKTPHWKLNPEQKQREHSKRDQRYADNCFSVVERLHFIANDFYKKRREHSKHTKRLKTVLLQASNGSGKTFAVSDLINSILKTTNHEILVCGGDPFEDGQNTEPFGVISRALRQLLDLRSDPKNYNTQKLFKNIAPELIQDKKKRIVYASLIKVALIKAKQTFAQCRVPEIAKAGEKVGHQVDTNQLYLLNELLGMNYTEPKSYTKTVKSKSLRTDPVAASRTMSAILSSKMNITLGERFTSSQANRMSLKLQSHKTLRASALETLSFNSAIKKTKNMENMKRFETQLVEFEEEVAAKNAKKVLPEDQLDKFADNVSEPSVLGEDSKTTRKFSVYGKNDSTKVYLDNDLGEAYMNERQSYLPGTAVKPGISGIPEDLFFKSRNTTIKKPDDIIELPKIKETVKLLAAILVGLCGDNIPILLNIDNAQLADPFSLLVVQELCQWWSAANIFLLLAIRKPFSENVGLSNIGNYVIEAGKRMSVVSLKINLNLAELSDLASEIQNSPNEAAAENATSTQILLQQLRDVKKVVSVNIVSDAAFTNEIIEATLQSLKLLEDYNNPDPLRVERDITRYMQRALGQFLYVSEALRLYLKHDLVKVSENGHVLNLTIKGRELFRKALMPQIGTIRNQKPSRKKAKPRGSMFELLTNNRNKERKNMFEYKIQNLNRLIPGSLNSAFSEYFDSLRLTEQLLLKCAALIAKSNKKNEVGKFSFDRVKQVCPFIYDNFQKSVETESDVDESFRMLENTKLIAPVENRYSAVDTKKAGRATFKFRSEWYMDILVSRLLPSQIRTIEGRIQNIREIVETEAFEKLPEKDKHKRGFLVVKKQGFKGFKKRFCVVKQGVLYLYKEDPENNASASNVKAKIFFKEQISAAYYNGPPLGKSIFGTNRDADNAFMVSCSQYSEYKKSKDKLQTRHWLFVAKTQAEAHDWLKKIQLHIRTSQSRVKLKM